MNLSIEILTERLKLIPCSDAALLTYTAEEYELGPHIEMHLEELKKDPSISGWGVWFVIDKQTDEIIGDMGFKGKPDDQKSVEIGYGIKPSEQNKGYATEALKCMIDWAFNSQSVNKIVAECLEDNSPSIRVLEKLNMANTGKGNGMLYWELDN
jgi:[ribosomal protein S5]-alanine N-acetyltransferase